MLSATRPTSATIASTAAASSELARRGQDEERGEAAEDEERGRKRPSRVRAEAEPGEERGPEHHDPENHGARVGPGSDGPDRQMGTFAQEAVGHSRFPYGDAPLRMGTPDARGERRGPRRVCGVHAAGVVRRCALRLLQQRCLQRPDDPRLRHRGLARVPREEGTRCLDGHHHRDVELGLRRALVRGLQSRELSVDRGRRVHRLLPAPLRRDGPASALARPHDRGHALARRRHRRPRRGCRRRGGASSRSSPTSPPARRPWS